MNKMTEIEMFDPAAVALKIDRTSDMYSSKKDDYTEYQKMEPIFLYTYDSMSYDKCIETFKTWEEDPNIKILCKWIKNRSTGKVIEHTVLYPQNFIKGAI